MTRDAATIRDDISKTREAKRQANNNLEALPSPKGSESIATWIRHVDALGATIDRLEARLRELHEELGRCLEKEG